MKYSHTVNLEVRHLKLVQAIAQEGTVTRAAIRLNLTQSALSHQLADVEERLAAPLFLRLKKRMLLTPAGERILAAAHSVLDELSRAEEDARRASSEDAGVLRISTECYTCYHWLPSRLRKFQLEFPRVDVQVVVEATHQPISYLLDGKLDVAIVSDPIRNRKLQLRPLFEDEMVVLMKPGHALASKSHIEACDFAEQTLLTYDVPRDDLTVFQRVLIPAGVLPKRHSSVALTEAIVELVKAGMGIAVLARWAVAPHLASGTLCARRLTGKGLFRHWGAVTLRIAPAPVYVQKFVDLLADAPFSLPNSPSAAVRK